MPEFLTQGLLTDLSIVLLVGLFDGIYRLTSGGRSTREEDRRDDLTRRGYIL